MKDHAISFFGLCLALLVFALPAPAEALEITDLAGRKVMLEKPAQTVVLGDGRVIPAIALLDRDDPTARITALISNLNWTDPRLLAELRDKFSSARSMQVFSGSADTVSVEKIITLAPDAAIFGVHDHGPGTRSHELIAQLEASGTAVVFIDFRMDPLKNTVPSIRVLGQLLGREKEAEEFIEFYSSRKQRVERRISKLIAKRPSVFLQVHAGRRQCCSGMAHGMLGPFVTFAGGHNISADVTPAMVGLHTLEFLVTANPDIWIGTASGEKYEVEQGTPVITLGSGVDAAFGRKTLQMALKSDELTVLKAYQQGRAHAIWHNFYNSPLNIFVLEQFAKWFHPQLFEDVDPHGTLTEIDRRFLPLDLNGRYSVSLRK
ncbi:MAG: ABC transporter substrate-binding protein [Pseudomonadota bacterium]